MCVEPKVFLAKKKQIKKSSTCKVPKLEKFKRPHSGYILTHIQISLVLLFPSHDNFSSCQ